MSNGDISKSLILKKFPKLPSGKYHFTSLKLPNSKDLGFFLLFPEMFSCFCLLLTAVLQIKQET